jgi:phosphatidylglycerophosphatase A
MEPPRPRAASFGDAREGRPGLMKQPVHLFAFGFGSGLAPRAPGTAGTLVALPLAWLMLGWPLGWRVGVVAALFAVGIWICGESARRLKTHDHPGIVFDEIVGLLATSLVLSGHPVWLLAAFVLFRFFDILKPWPIRDLDHRLMGGLGIMLDDVMAAVYAAAGLVGLRFLLSLN